MDNLRIRPYEPGDEHALGDVFHSSVTEAARADYTNEQVRAWAAAGPKESDFRGRALDGRLILVAVDSDDRVVAYADLEANGHIDHMYCRPEWVGEGVGSALYDAIEMAARTRGISRLFVEASEVARRLFERKGFRVGRRNEVEVHGVWLHNFDMAKDL